MNRVLGRAGSQRDPRHRWPPEALRVAEFLCALLLPRWTEVTGVSVAEAKRGILPDASLPESLRRTLFDAAKACADEMIMGFSIFVELLNLRLRKAHAVPVKLHQSYVSEAAQGIAPAKDEVQE